MAAFTSLSEKLATTIRKELQNSSDSHPAVSSHVRTLVKEVLAWQRRIHNRGQIPNKYSLDDEERNLGNRFSKLLYRRCKAVGKEPSRSQLLPSEVALVNSVPGVKNRCDLRFAANRRPPGASCIRLTRRDRHRPSHYKRRGVLLQTRYVQSLVEDVVDWQTRKAALRIPQWKARDVEERRLGLRFQKLLYRRDKALSAGKRYSYPQLSHSEAALVNSVPGVPLHGCSATASCSNRGDQLEAGRTKVRKKLAAGSSSSSRGSRSGRKKAENNGSIARTKKEHVRVMLAVRRKGRP